MWCPEGYITLEEIISQLLWDIDQLPLAQGKPLVLQRGQHIPDNLDPDKDEADAFIKWSCAAIFRLFGKDIRICTTSGTLVRVNPSVLLVVRAGWLGLSPTIAEFPTEYDERLEIAEWEIPCVDLNWGTVQASADFAPLGQIAGSSICIKEGVLPVQMSGLTEWLLQKAPKLGSPYLFSTEERKGAKTEAELIVQAVLSGKVRTKNEAQKMFGQGLKAEAWTALWKMAVTIDDRLSRPGPRPR